MTSRMSARNVRIGIAAVLAITLIAGLVVVVRSVGQLSSNHYVAYFANSNGLFPGDEVRILGVAVGEIQTIEPQPDRAKVAFTVDEKYAIPADVKAVILSPQLVTSRAIQLTPVYTSGPKLSPDAVIPLDRTAVPVEWDDLREQLERLTESLQPTEPGGVSPLGALINTAADNLRGQGANVRATIIRLAQAFSALGDQSDNLYSTIKNLSVLVSALQSSTDLMAQLNRNLAAVTALLANDDNEVANAVRDINSAATDVRGFIADNRDAAGTATEKLASVTTAVYDSLDDIKQTLHVAPNGLANFANIWQPAQGSGTGALAANNFANPVTFICGAIQAASKLGAEQSAKLCVQYLAPIFKNRQYNFPPLGFNPFVGAMARPNEITYSEDRLRPDYVPTPLPVYTGPPPAPLPAEAAGAPPAPAPGAPPAPGPLSAEAPMQSQSGVPGPAPDPAAGLRGLMVPPGGGA